MKTNTFDLNELLPRFAKGTIIGNALNIYIRKVFLLLDDRILSLPCETSFESVSHMTQEELNQLVKDISLKVYSVIFDRYTQNDLVSKLFYTREKWGTLKFLTLMLSTYTETPESNVSVRECFERDLWRYVVYMENPGSLNIRSLLMLQKIIPETQRAVLQLAGIYSKIEPADMSDMYMTCGSHYTQMVSGDPAIV